MKGHLLVALGICACVPARSVPPQRKPSLPVAEAPPQPQAPSPLLVADFGPHACPNPMNPGPVNPPANLPVQVRVGPPLGTVPPSALEVMEGESTLGEVCAYESHGTSSLVVRSKDWRDGVVVRRTRFNLNGGDCSYVGGECDPRDPVFAISKDPCDDCSQLNAAATSKAKGASGLFARTVTGGLVRSVRTVPLMQYDLREAQDKALLTVTALGPDVKAFKKLKPVWSRRYVGERVEASQTTTLYLHALDALAEGAYFLDDDAKTMEVSCTKSQLSIAAADAVLVPKISATSAETECGDSSAVWQPSKLRERSAYVCFVTHMNGKTLEDGSQPSIVFTPDQSIERVEVNNDCMMQGGGYRLVPSATQVARMHRAGDGY